MKLVWETCPKCGVLHLCSGYPRLPGGAIEKLGKLSNLTVGLDFESQPTHEIDFDPAVETRTIKGREGDFEVIAVKEGGVSYDLSLSNKSLLRELQKITVPSRLKLTRTGKSFDTKYVVQNLGPVRK